MKEAPKVVEEMVFVELTQSEAVARGKDHAEALNLLDAMKERHAEAKKKLKLERDNAEEKERDLRKIVETGREQRPINCYEEPDFKKGVVTTRRADTNAEIGTRKMSDEERQTHIAGLGSALGNTTPEGEAEKKPRRGGPRAVPALADDEKKPEDKSELG